MNSATRSWASTIALGSFLLFGSLSGPAGAQPGHDSHDHQHLDQRFAHDHYYYDRGYRLRRPIPGWLERHDDQGNRYWYRYGDWYRWNRGTWVVWDAPVGVFVPALPPFYTTVWLQGAPYYYANDTFYAWDETSRQYRVVVPPNGIDTAGTIQPPTTNDLFIYPKNGQSDAQQQSDRYECHRFALGQTGFDPTLAGGGVSADQAEVKRKEYLRAEASCLGGRGYAVE